MNRNHFSPPPSDHLRAAHSITVIKNMARAYTSVSVAEEKNVSEKASIKAPITPTIILLVCLREKRYINLTIIRNRKLTLAPEAMAEREVVNRGISFALPK